jgi:hypothetical protein
LYKNYNTKIKKSFSKKLILNKGKIFDEKMAKGCKKKK